MRFGSFDGLLCKGQPEDSQKATGVVVIPAVGMAVRDQDRALAFYIAELVAFLMSDVVHALAGRC